MMNTKLLSFLNGYLHCLSEIDGTSFDFIKLDYIYMDEINSIEDILSYTQNNNIDKNISSLTIDKIENINLFEMWIKDRLSFNNCNNEAINNYKEYFSFKITDYIFMIFDYELNNIKCFECFYNSNILYKDMNKIKSYKNESFIFIKDKDVIIIECINNMAIY